MNGQLGDLANIVLSLTEKLSSNIREGIGSPSTHRCHDRNPPSTQLDGRQHHPTQNPANPSDAVQRQQGASATKPFTTLCPQTNKKHKLNYFRSLLRDNAIEFWQTLRITTETTLRDILTAFKKENAKKELTEVSMFKFDQLRFDSNTESFNTFLSNYHKIAKHAYGDQAQDIAQTTLFAYFPIQLQN